MNICYVPISLGELYDKYSILLIKMERIFEDNKKIEISKESSFLKQIIEKYNLSYELQEKIKNINEQLWVIEDNIRKKEVKQEFDDEFIQLARQVYKINDERCRIKVEINKTLNSQINDIKSYL
jgi:hypothetical protein